MNKLSKILKLFKYRREFRAALSTQLSLLEGDKDFALGGLTEIEEKALVGLVQRAKSNSGPIIEFGTLFGITSKLLASVAEDSQRIITVDNFCWNPFGLTPELHEAFTRKILRVELECKVVDLVVSGSEEYREAYSNDVPSMVFFDADHSYAAVKNEIQWAKSLGTPLICGHDYNNERFGVTQAVNEEFPDGVETAGMVWWKELK